MPAKDQWYIKYFDDMDMYEISFDTKTAYITVEMYEHDGNIEFKDDEFGGSIVDGASNTTISLFQYGGNKGITVGSDYRGGGVSGTFIPLPDDMYEDIAKYIQNGVLEDHAYPNSNIVQTRAPNTVHNNAATDPENPNITNTGDPLAGGARRGSRRESRRGKTMRRRRAAKKSRKHRK
jgi:hypothetical protein